MKTTSTALIHIESMCLPQTKLFLSEELFSSIKNKNFLIKVRHPIYIYTHLSLYLCISFYFFGHGIKLVIISTRFIGEETVSRYNSLPELTNDPTWIIDPIDGTTNFVHTFPYTCVSIALVINKEIEIGIVYNPVLKQLFTAKRGYGAFLNEKPIASSNIESKSFNLSLSLARFVF